MTASWQQVLALDARYNAHRAPNHPNFRTLYIRRRSQLLRERSDQEPSVTRHYLKLRAQLLQQRYGAAPEQGSSLKSRSLSARSSSRMSESPGLSRYPSQSLASPSSGSGSATFPPGVVPTREAEASRAMVGGTTLEENYAFAGVHRILDQHKAALSALQFAHDERRRLACASLDGTVSICDVGDGEEGDEWRVLVLLRGHSSGVTDLHWSLANDLLLTCSLDGTLRLWNPSTGVCLRTVGGQGPSAPQLLCCTFQPNNNNMVVAGNSRGTLQVLNVSTGIALKGGVGKMSGKVLSLTFDAVGEILWAGDEKGMVASFLFDFASGRLRRGHRLSVRENCPITCLSARAWISREARDPSLLVNCAANALFLFKVVDEEGTLQLKKAFPLRHRTHRIRSTFCPIMSFRQGACVVSGSEDCSVYFLDVEREGRPLVNRLQGHAAPVLAVAFNYNESLLATGDAQGLIIVWKREDSPTSS